MSEPLAIDLYCGLGGWTDGLLAEGWRVVGFDIEQHIYGEHRYPTQLVIQDVLTLHGAQFRTADLIVASPPCQAYSYRAMPWSRAKALPPPDNALFEACFRIQREACEAAGRHIPLIVENVRGAQKWVGRSRWNYGSFHLWGDVPALMPMTKALAKVGGIDFNGYGTPGYKGQAFNTTAEARLREHIKNDGGSWFNVAHNTTSGHSNNPVMEHIKGSVGYDRDHPAAFGWKKPNTSSHSTARKFASAMIAKIPFALSSYIGRVFKPSSKPLPRDDPPARS